MKIKTVADLKRIPIGTKLRLVDSLVGPKNHLRELSAVRSKDLLFTILEGPNIGKVSHLRIPKASELEPTDDGFAIIEEGRGVLLRYRFESVPSCAPGA